MSSSVPATPNVSSSAHHHHNHHLEEREAAERRRKKKTEYLKQRKLELEKEAELASKYRDRARERRDHQEKDDENAAAVAAAEKVRVLDPSLDLYISYLNYACESVFLSRLLRIITPSIPTPKKEKVTKDAIRSSKNPNFSAVSIVCVISLCL